LPLLSFYKDILIDQIKKSNNTEIKKKMYHHYLESLNINKLSLIADMNMYVDYMSSIGKLALILDCDNMIYDNNEKELKIMINKQTIILRDIDQTFYDAIQEIHQLNKSIKFCPHFRGQVSSYIHCKFRSIESDKSWNDITELFVIEDNIDLEKIIIDLVI
jgi:hypothetical protein